MKALDSWARQFGYADFDTYIQAGGSIDDVRRDIAKRMRNLQIALDALNFTGEDPMTMQTPPRMAKTPPPEPPGNFHTDPDEPPDPDNAHTQGAEHG